MNYYLLEAEGEDRAATEKEMAEFLGVSTEDLEFEVLAAKKGLMGLFKSSKAELYAYPAHEDIPIEAHARGVVTTLLQKIGIEAEIRRISQKDDNLFVELSSADTGFIIGKHGRTLDALQFLVNLIVHNHCKDNQRIMLDVDGYRDRREKSLKELATRIADKVSKNGRSILLNYMNPYERRIVHLFLEGDERVTTESDGNGVYKRLRIISNRKKNPPRSRRRSSNQSEEQQGDLDGNQQVLTDEGYDYPQEDLYEEPSPTETIVEGNE